MAKFIFKDGKWIDKATGEESPIIQRWKYGEPWRGSISSDYEGYECPVTGKWVEGRKAHRDNLKRTGCRLLEPGEKEDVQKNGKKRREAAIDKAVDRAVEMAAKDFI